MESLAAAAQAFWLVIGPYFLPRDRFGRADVFTFRSTYIVTSHHRPQSQTLTLKFFACQEGFDPSLNAISPCYPCDSGARGAFEAVRKINR